MPTLNVVVVLAIFSMRVLLQPLWWCRKRERGRERRKGLGNVLACFGVGVCKSIF